MEQDETAIPIVFIRDSKQLAAASSHVQPAAAETAEEAEKAGIEEVIYFFTQTRPGG